MTLRSGLAQMGRELAALSPHEDRVALLSLGPTSNEYGEDIPATEVAGDALPCIVDRISSEDAVKAGLGGSTEVLRVVIDARTSIAASSSLLLTRWRGEAVNVRLSVKHLSGTLRTVLLCEVMA